MSQNSYNHAIEITKILLQSQPHKVINLNNANPTPEETSVQIAKFVRELADVLSGIEKEHSN